MPISLCHLSESPDLQTSNQEDFSGLRLTGRYEFAVCNAQLWAPITHGLLSYPSSLMICSHCSTDLIMGSIQ